MLALWSVAYAAMAGFGRFYPAVLAAAAVAFLGAVTRLRAVAVAGWLGVAALVAYALAYSQVHSQTGSRFDTDAFGLGIDLVAAFLPLTALGVASAFAVRGEPRRRDAGWLVPAIALTALERTWTPGEGEPWAHVALGGCLFAGPLIAALAWRGRARLGAAVLLGAAAAPEAVWLSAALQSGDAAALATLLGLGGAAAASLALLAMGTHGSPGRPQDG